METSLELTGGHYTPEKVRVEIYQLEMRQGLKSKMYTLRRVASPLHPKPSFAKEEHITNLSTDKEKAWLKAVNYANSYGMELYDDSMDKLRKIVRVSDGYINFGKNEGKHVSELEDSYVIWVAEGSLIKYQDTYGGISFKRIACEETIKFCIDECIKRGLFVEFEGKFIDSKKRDYIIKLREGTGHHHVNGDKVELVLDVVSTKSFVNTFGYSETITNILTLVSPEGLKYTYRGSIGRYSKGDKINIKATVIHGNYNGEDITYLKNPKDIETQAHKNFNKIKEGTVLERTEDNGDKSCFVVTDDIDDQAVTGIKDGEEYDIFKSDLNIYGKWKIIKF